MIQEIAKTSRELTKAYYFRQLILSSILIPIPMVFFLTQGANKPLPMGMLGIMVLNTLLYPYSRFVYERVMGFIVGNNVFLVNASMALLVKYMTMFVCWLFAIFIAPVGLLLSYFVSKTE